MSYVIGQTGSIVLSDDGLIRARGMKRTVRYRYQPIKCGAQTHWLCEVIGPFHSVMYGACSYGTKKTSAKKALVLYLGNRFGYIGRLLFSNVDASDNVGKVDFRLINEGTMARPITNNILVGSAGQ